MLAGASNVSFKMYEGARHELFNESCREDYYEYLDVREIEREI